MSSVREAPFSRELNALTQQIAAIESRSSAISSQLASAKREADRLQAAYLYRRLQIAVRRPKLKFGLWPLGFLIIGSLTPGLLVFTILSLQTVSAVSAIAVGSITGVVALLILSVLQFVPNDNEMIRQYHINAKRYASQSSLVEQIRLDLACANEPLAIARSRRNEIERSVQYKREQLLRHNWKAMRGDEWEAYLADVFILLGARVQRTGRSGDQGVDLIVDINGRRYAVQTKGYVSSVGNSAVQEAVAGKAYHGCNRCAVITNSRFTQGAIELAACNNCLLVGEDDIHLLVLGKIQF